MVKFCCFARDVVEISSVTSFYDPVQLNELVRGLGLRVLWLILPGEVQGA